MLTQLYVFICVGVTSPLKEVCAGRFIDDLIFGIEHHFQQYFSFITCECDSSAPFFVIYKAGREPTPYWR
jgi:hypothetical protein